jgi:hypothetical protein
MQEELHAFLRHARDKGLDYATIRTLLLAAGWKERDVAAAIACQSLDVAVPVPAGARGARDAFLYLLTFVLLYIAVGSAIALYFIFLDYLYPDPAWMDWQVGVALVTVRHSIAAILVSFPLFVFLTLVLDCAVAKERDGQGHPVRKWLTYLTLFLAASVIVVDLITLLYFFLEGALTTRFVLKVVALLVICEVVLSYYFLSPRPDTQGRPPHRLRRFPGIVGSLLIAGSVVLGFAMAGSPFKARHQRLDEKRVEDLRAIHRTIQRMVTKTDITTNTVTVIRALPKTLDEVAGYQATKEAGRRLDVIDPQTGERYTYTVTGEKTYELCATFALPRDKKRDLFWNHRAGSHCYQFSVESPP